jgi:signal transduction histidine kinase
VDASEHDRPLRRAPVPLADGRYADRPPRPAPLASGAIPALPAERAAAILEGIGEVIIVLDRETRVTWWNAAAERSTGVRREDVLGWRLFDRFPRLAGTRVEHELRQVAARRQAREFPGWKYQPSAEGRAPGIYDARVWPLDDGGLLLLCTEVTAREAQKRELEARIRENEELRDFARAMAGIADSGALLRLLCSAAMAHVGGTSSIVARDVGDGMGECIAAAGAARAIEGTRFPLAGSIIARVLATGKPVVLERYSSDSPFFRGVAAEEQLGAIVMTPLVAHGEPLGVFGLARRRGAAPFTDADLARLGVYIDHASLAAWKAQLLERAESANEAKASFLASMSHELRTPLTALTGYGELLADEILGPLAKPQLEVVERMRSVTHHLSSLIDELLTYSSLEAGREHARMRSASPADIVDEALMVIEPLARQKALAFEATSARTLPAIVTDADKVRQILVNLLGNAVKFTDRGSVRLDYTCTDDELRFHVWDTGCGIARADHGRLFQPFGQLDGGLTRRHGGTGLGLYISRRLAELLGGHIRLESELGKGATFTLVLPR